MSDSRRATALLTWPKAALFIAGAAICFHLAYWPANFAPAHLAILGYVICLVQLARLETARRAFYAGLVTALLCVGPQLVFFWRIFGPAAIALWAILALWIGAFTGITSASLRRFGPLRTAVLIPFVWLGLEYFRSELYYLKFAWMNVGYVFSDFQAFPIHLIGMYGIGFVAALIGAAFLVLRWYQAAGVTIVILIASSLPSTALIGWGKPAYMHIAGIQMEFPNEQQIIRALDFVVAKHPETDVLVLSEYTLDGPVPDSLKTWCREHQRYLVVGGKDPAPNNNFYDTAFVVGTNGDIVFRQGKSVPIQFFKDGLPTPKQDVWDSPWGKIGFCVCYDLSYTRVIDGLINQGAQLLIVPTMDLAEWGQRQHQLHALVAPVRAAEYRIPIFRLASSGISQAVMRNGHVTATAPFPGEGAELFATLEVARHPSVPADRPIALLAVTITGVLLAILCFTKPKQAAAVVSVNEPRENKSAAPTM